MSVRILVGDVRARLRDLADGSVHCVVTSPPYFGLRDYGTGTWAGGDPACDHIKPFSGEARNVGRDRAVSGGTFHDNPVPKQIVQQYGGACLRCGAIRTDSQIGVEATPQAYVDGLVAVFREVKRVLRDDGTVWLNLGDSYAGSWGNQGRKEQRGTQRPINGPMLQPVLDGRYGATDGNNTGKCPPGVKPKDLLMIPARLAIALQADGWWLRSDIIWSKPNPMPESVTDRPTSAHEHVFLFAKSASYFYDQEAIRDEPTGRTDAIRSFGAVYKRTGKAPPAMDWLCGANAKNVWTIATVPYAEAHFATFPPELAERCIKAGSRPGDTILDPFAGSGTTALVADRLRRDAVLIELKPEYAEMAQRRLLNDGGMFMQVAAE